MRRGEEGELTEKLAEEGEAPGEEIDAGLAAAVELRSLRARVGEGRWCGKRRTRGLPL
jgi:hypothetical protein